MVDLNLTTFFGITGTTVANLPSAYGPRAMYIVTDALEPTIEQPVIGGGSVEVIVVNLNGAWFPLCSPPNMSYQPPFPPYAITLTEPFTWFGHSFVAKSTNRICVLDLLRDRYAFGILDNEGKAGQTTTEIADRVTNIDTTIYDSVADLSRAEQISGHVIVTMGRNSFSQTAGNSTIMATAFADRDRSIAALTGDWLLTSDSGIRSAGMGGVVWAQCTDYRRRTMAEYPEKVVDWLWVIQQYADPNVLQDSIDLYNDMLPSTATTFDTGEIDNGHAGTKGNKAIGYGPIWNWLRYLENDSVWMPPFHEAYVSGAAADAAITTNGVVYNTPFLGNNGTFSIVTGDATKFTVNSISGQIRCVSAFVPTLPYYELKIRLTKEEDEYVDCLLRLWIGKNTSGCDDRPVSRDTGGPIVFATSPSGISSKAYSLIVGVSTAANTDGTKMYLRGSETSTFAVFRDTDNRVKITARNASGTIIANYSSNTTLTTANGMTWIATSFDLSPNTPIATLCFNNENVLTANSATLTQNGTLDWNKRAVVLSDGSTLTYTWNGVLRDYWETTSYIDWTNSSKRDERFNSSTLDAVVLPVDGQIDSKLPIIWTPGNLSDLYWGRCGTDQSAGTGPRGIGCARHYPNPGAGGEVDGNFTPLDLGAKLLSWHSADDFGTPNMTTETGDRLVSWVDRIGGMTLTQTSESDSRPTWIDNFDGNGISVVQGSVSQYMETVSFPALPVGTTSGRAFISSISESSGTLFSYGTNGGGGILRRLTMNGNYAFSASDGSVSVTTQSDLVLNWRVVDVAFRTTGFVINVDGLQVATSGSSSMNTGSTLFRLMAGLTPIAGGSPSASIRHLIFTTDTLTTDEYQKLQAWLAWDQGRNLDLPATHPYRNYRP